MASSRDLKEVLWESLENRGALGEIKARIRAEVFRSLDDQSEAKPPISNENVLIYELIREFLEYNNCKYTTSVLVSETGLPKAPLDREFLRNELNVVEDGPARSVPLLYSLVSCYREGQAERNSNTRGFSQSTGVQSKTFVERPHPDSVHTNPDAVIVRGRQI